jgi:hypothetical protein
MAPESESRGICPVEIITVISLRIPGRRMPRPFAVSAVKPTGCAIRTPRELQLTLWRSSQLQQRKRAIPFRNAGQSIDPAAGKLAHVKIARLLSSEINNDI